MKYQIDAASIAQIIRRLDRAIERAKKDRKKLKDLIDKAENKLANHGERITQNETDIETGRIEIVNHRQRITTNESDIAAGKIVLADHEQRIAALENP